MLTQQDLKQLAQKGISEQQIETQLGQFKTGFPFLKLEAAAAIGHGIVAPTSDEGRKYVDAWQKYKAAGKRVVKFVPASGAASRMFKDMFAFVDADYDKPTTDFEKKYFDNIEKFAFYNELDAVCQKNNGKGIKALIQEGNFKAVAANMLKAEGLNYGQLPKGLLLFHNYPEGPRTPMEEHLVEGALYAASNGEAHVHFTVSHEHMELFKQKVAQKADLYAKKYGIAYDITFSEQKPSTDTVAANPDGTPFRNSDGSLLFRPGGHGALIENLNEIDADVIFVKNIDNVVPDRLKGDTVLWKQIIAGVLVTLQKKAFEYLELLDTGKYTHEQIEEMIRFVQQDLCCRKADIKELEDADLVIYLRKKLNRPMRVCGVVKNIDNVVPDRLKPETVEWKQIIAGVLVTLQEKAFEYLRLLDTGKYSHEQIEEIIRFVQQDLCCRKSDIKELEDAELVIYLRNKLNRPMRVCGVVKNVGEPGGGPFLTYNQDGTVSLQILESSQIDKSNKEYMEMFTKGTHFNPVDLVCAVKDYKGNAFDLPKYVDPTTGFISQKSKSGKELQALELPGLWNGAMSAWSTIFVEVPLGTFNPVKTVNDLLREQHQ